MPLEAEKGITPHIRRLLDLGVLRPVQSAWNTLLLPVKKLHTNDNRLVQDMWEVNKRVVDTPATVPNAYNLLSSMSSDWQWYTTVLDLKGSLFSLSLAPRDPPYFALNVNPEISNSDKVTWTRLPHRFKTSIFDEVLHQDLCVGSNLFEVTSAMILATGDLYIPG